MTPLQCSGLVTISNTTNLETEFLSIPKGANYATTEDPMLYVDYVLNRKALIVDVILQSLFEFNLISKTVYLCIFHFNIFRQNCMLENC